MKNIFIAVFVLLCVLVIPTPTHAQQNLQSILQELLLQVQSLQKQLNALAEKQGISLSVPDTSPLITQTLSSKVINKNQVQLTWNAIPEASHYRVYRKNTYTSEFDLIANLSANPLYGTTFNASWYPCGTHTFYLQTVNAKGVELASSNQVEVSITEGCPTVPGVSTSTPETPTTTPINIGIQVPRAPSINVSVVDNNKVKIVWNPISDAKSYRVYKKMITRRNLMSLLI